MFLTTITFCSNNRFTKLVLSPDVAFQTSCVSWGNSL
jgi:hypothetical protein